MGEEEEEEGGGKVGGGARNKGAIFRRVLPERMHISCGRARPQLLLENTGVSVARCVFNSFAFEFWALQKQQL